MKARLVIATAIALATSVAVADRLPRTLSFVNETDERVVPNQTEGSANEKEVEFGDLDRDGDLDVVVAVGSAGSGARKNKIYFNEDGVLVEKSGKPLIPEFAMEDVSRNAFIRDYNLDGWPDIYIVNDANSPGFAGEHKIYIAQHDGKQLTGYSEERDIRLPANGDLGASCGGVSADFDGDGDIDVYAGNYPGPPQDFGLYLDDAFNFADLTKEMIPVDADYTVDVALADMNGDGKMDLLVSNDRDPSYIYYNDLGKDSTGLGDFKSADSAQFVGLADAHENGMEPADFDNDGDQDIYWSNFVGSHGDRVFENTGNDESNRAMFDVLDILPDSVRTVQSRKATVADFNADGLIDVFVAMQHADRRPVVLRNTSTGPGAISFVEWSPAPAFPSDDGTLRGWHGAAFDTGGDGDVDLLIGGFSRERLLENIRATEVDEDDLGPFPALWDGEPVAVQGRGDGDDVDEYVIDDVGDGFLSVVLNGPGDYLLEIVDPLDQTIASSDRGGLDVEEAVQVNTSAGTHTVRVTIVEGAETCDYGGDFNGDCEVDFNDMLGVLSNWGCTDCLWDLDGEGAGFSDLLVVLDGWGPVTPRADYLLEVLGRGD